MRLIDADKAKEKLRGNAQKDGNPFVGAIVEMFCEFLDQAPTVEDAEERGEIGRVPRWISVVHGQWVDNGIPESMLSKCSVCGFGCGAYTFQFCPKCGAIMDLPYIDAENEPSPDDYVDYGGVFINAAGEYKLNTAYTEILSLHEILKNNRVPHEFHRLYDGWQICYPDEDHWKISAVQHYVSYGAKDNRIEIMGGITPYDGKCDGVLGHLTAEDVFARIVTMHKAASTYENADRCVCCGDVIPEGRQVCPGCEGGEG